jgi:phosphatidylglycerol:prolipoprotein diacylglycerol transferase
MQVLVFPNVDNVAFAVQGFAIYWYSLAYVLGILLGYYLLIKLNGRSHMFPVPVLEDLLFYAVLGIIVGGRLGFCLFYDLAHTLEFPLNIFLIRSGGMSFHGGILGVVCAILWVARKHSVAVFGLGDLVSCVAPIGLGLGRFANFINQESIGLPANWGVGIIFPKVDLVPRYPTQILEALVQGPILLVLMIGVHRYYSNRQGLLSAAFLIYYGTTRFIIELLKEPEGYVYGMNIAQFMCLLMVLLGCLIYSQACWKKFR